MSKCDLITCGERILTPQAGDCCAIADDKRLGLCYKGIYYPDRNKY